MKDGTLGVGIIGFGFMGKTHAYAHRTLPFFYPSFGVRTKLVGVCTRRAEALEAAQRIGGFEVGVTDHRALLERDDIQIIHVCTPNDAHKEAVVDALAAGKHVYCDKPLARTAGECGEIVAAVEKFGRGQRLVNQVALQCRFYPATLRAKQLVDEGFLGKIFSFRACYLHSSSINPDKSLGWKLDRARGGGGVLLDLGSHVLDLLGHLVGPFEKVMADTATHIKQRPLPGSREMVHVESEDIALLLLRTRDGACGTVEASKLATGSNDELRIEIHGERGAMRFNLMDPNWLEVYDVRDPAEPIGGMRGFKRIETVGRFSPPGGSFPGPAMNVGWLAAHVASVFNFVDCAARGVAAHPDFSEAAELQRVMELAYQSAQRGGWVEV